MKLKKIKSEVEKLKSKIVPTTTNLRQFEINRRSDCKLQSLIRNVEWIENHYNLIGEIVYNYDGDFNYYDTELEYKSNGYTKLVLTLDLYEQFQVKYLNYQIERRIENLIYGSITNNSTCKLTNLDFEWELECTQELIKFYKEILE